MPKPKLLSATLGALLAAAPALAADPGQTATADHGWFLPPGASNHVKFVDGPMDFINLVTVFFFTLIIALMFFFAVKYRRRTPDQKALSQASHSTGLELGWTLPPVVIVIACFVMGFRGYLEMNTFPGDGYTVDVTAQQFSWTFQHPNGLVESNQVLNVPAGKPVVCRLTSKDVIHSMFIPDFRVKKDVVRGRFNYLWFIADKPTPFADEAMPTSGKAFDDLVLAAQTAATRAKLEDEATKAHKQLAEADVQAAVQKELAALTPDAKKGLAESAWQQKVAENGHIIFCAEMCGVGHSIMMARVVVHKSDWEAPKPKINGTPAELGKLLFQSKGCSACHMPPAGAPAPQCPPFANGIYGKKEHVMIGLGGPSKEITVDDDYILESILNPMAKIVVGYPPIMPPGLATPEEAQKILAYLKTLKAK